MLKELVIGEMLNKLFKFAYPL